MSHATTRRRRLSSDKADNGFLHVLLDEVRGFLFVAATDLAHHRDGLGLWIGLERGEAVDEIRPVDWIAADPDTCRLSEPGSRELINHFVRQRARSTDDADVS